MSEVAAPVTTVVESTGTHEQTGTKVDVFGSEGVTFDDLNAVHSEPRKETSASKKEAKEDESEKKADSKPDEKEQKPDKEIKADKAEVKKADGEKEDKPKVETKKAKYKLGDKELDLEETATFKHKVNGQDVEVSVKDLLDNYSGKVAWEKRFSDFDKERKSYQSKTAQNEQMIKKIFAEQDPELRFYKMAELSGKDPLEVRRKYLEDNMNLLEKWNLMSDDERKADELAFENKILKAKSQAHESRESQRQATEHLDREVKGIMASQKIEQQDFVKRYDELVDYISKASNPEERKALEKQMLNPKFIAETIVKDRLWNAAETQVKALKLNIPQEELTKRISYLTENAYDNGLSPEDVSELVSEMWGEKFAQRVVDEKNKDREEVLTGKKTTETQAPRYSEMPTFFDELNG